MARDEDGSALRGKRAQQLANPADPIGVEPIHRLVEHQYARIAEQSDGDAEALAHAQRELTHPLLGDRRQANQLEYLVDPLAWDLIGARQHPQVGMGTATRVEGTCLEQRANLAQWRFSSW